ncbi:hypothetical protein FB446DRAFT_794436, partial [Lentinula raphanica]
MPSRRSTLETIHDKPVTLEQVTASRPDRFRTPEPPEFGPPPPPTFSSQLPSSSIRQTPAGKIRGTLSGAYLTANGVERKRTIFATRDIPQMIPEISVDFFLEKILPPLPSSLIDKIDTVLKSLESQDAISVKQDRWTAFSVDPAVTAGHSNVYGREPVVFQPLAKIFEQVVAAAKQIDGALQQTFGLFVT